MHSVAATVVVIIIIVITLQLLLQYEYKMVDGDAPADNLLLIVGHVTNSSARILYERLKDNNNNNNQQQQHSQQQQQQQQHQYMVKLYEKQHTTTTTIIEERVIPSDWNRPQVIQFSHLKENTAYEVHFDEQQQTEEFNDFHFNNSSSSTTSSSSNSSINSDRRTAIVTFKTFCTQSCDLDSPLKILVVSCNRFNEDGDDSMWNQMTQLDSDRHGMIHLGDQIYADEVVRNYRALLSSLSSSSSNRKQLQTQQQQQQQQQQELPSFDNLVEQFRQIYRKSFGHVAIQRVLRHGAHWMIPDDHDILNGLNRDQFMKSNNNNDTTTTDISIVLKAGRQAFYEYQFQLYTDTYQFANSSSSSSSSSSKSDFDCTSNHHLTSNSTPHYTRIVERDAIFYSMKMANVCWLMLDFRFQNTFQFDPNSRLIGQQQWQFIEQQLEECSKYARATLVFSSIPILVMSDLFTSTMFRMSGERYTNHPDYLPDTVRLLNLFAEYKMKTNMDVRFIGGDVHQFFISQICNGTICLDQMVTSGVSKRSTQIKSLAGVIPFAINRHFQTVKAGPWKLYRNDNAANPDLQQYLGMNYGRIVIVRSSLLPADDDKNYHVQWQGAFNIPLSTRERVYQNIHDRLPMLLVATLVITSLICTLLFQICWFKCSNCFSARGVSRYNASSHIQPEV